MKNLVSFSLLAVFIFSVNCGAPTEKKQIEPVKKVVFETTGEDIIIEYFPRTHRQQWDAKPLIIIDPVLFDSKLLYKNKTSLIPWLNYQGLDIWLISLASYERLNLYRLGEEYLPPVIEQVSKISAKNSFYLGGVSLGGRAVAGYMRKLNPVTALDPNKIEASRIFFLGTGLDYNYPRSFLLEAETTGVIRSHLQKICPKRPSFCDRYFKNRQGELMLDHLKYLPAEPASAPDGDDWLTRGTVPALFIAGKIDSISPSETMFLQYKKYASSISLNYTAKRMFIAGRANRLSHDYDHFDLFLDERASKELYPMILNWLQE